LTLLDLIVEAEWAAMRRRDALGVQYAAEARAMERRRSAGVVPAARTAIAARFLKIAVRLDRHVLEESFTLSAQ
jgi:hypothetical protein